MDLIGLNNPLYQGVANHVSRAKVRKRDPLDGTQHPDGMPQPGLGFTWEVNLRHITRDNDGGPKANSRQEHLHLLRRCILTLIQNDKRIVQGAPAHVSKGSDFDESSFDQFFYSFKTKQLIKRIVKRP